MNGAAPVWVELVVAAALLASGVLAIVAAVGVVRLRTFFERLHPPALANTLAAWCVSLGSILYLSTVEQRLALHPLVVNILLAITAPITTVLLARTALFRERQAGKDVPPALSGPMGDPVADVVPHAARDRSGGSA